VSERSRITFLHDFIQASEGDSGFDVSVGLRVAAPAKVKAMLFEKVEGALLDGNGGGKRLGES
jgi:hypothetical protein